MGQPTSQQQPVPDNNSLETIDYQHEESTIEYPLHDSQATIDYRPIRDSQATIDYQPINDSQATIDYRQDLTTTFLTTMRCKPQSTNYTGLAHEATTQQIFLSATDNCQPCDPHDSSVWHPPITAYTELLQEQHADTDLFQDAVSAFCLDTESFAERTSGTLYADAQKPWTKAEAFMVIPGPWHTERCFWMDVCTGECTPIGAFKVEGDTDLLTPDELHEYEELVIAADREEIKSFLEQGVFKLRKTEFAQT